MKIQEIKELLGQFDASTLTEFDLKDGGFELYFNKNSESRKTVTAGSATSTPAVPVAMEGSASHQLQLANNSLANETIQNVAPEAPASDVTGTEIVSPVVGIVYLQPAPDQLAFKAVGDRVKKGEVVCIVEAMKVMNEITADIDGEIVAIKVENEQVVEFNQPLFIVKEG